MGFLLHGAPPDSALGPCLPRLAASVPGGASDVMGGGENAGSGGMLCIPCSCSKAFRAMNRWCCRLFRLCFLRSTSLAFGFASKGHRCWEGSVASLGTIPICLPLGAREAWEVIFQRGSTLEQGRFSSCPHVASRPPAVPTCPGKPRSGCPLIGSLNGSTRLRSLLIGFPGKLGSLRVGARQQKGRGLLRGRGLHLGRAEPAGNFKA